MVGFAALGRPWSRLLLGGLASRGALVAAPVGLFVYHFMYWLGLFPGWFPNGTGYAWGVMVVFAAASVVLATTSRALPGGRAGSRAVWLAGIGVLALAFVVGVWVRFLNPEIAGTEKPMDLTLLWGAWRSSSYPPFDPWYAGEHINYYYLGYSIAAAMAHLTTAAPPVAYNLFLATLFALTVVGGAGAGYDLAGLLGFERLRRHAALLSALAIAVTGNLIVLRAALSEAFRGKYGFWDGIGWHASRAIQSSDADGLTDYTINEFPSFSFILGDLHPHVMALPFTVLSVSVAVHWVAQWWGNGSLVAPRSLTAAAMSGLVLGGLYGLNAWDLPVFTGLALGGGVVAHALGPTPRRWRELAAHVGVALGVGVAAWLPFHLYFDPISASLGLVAVRSSVADFVEVFALPMFVIPVGLVALAWPFGRRNRVVIAGLAFVAVAFATVVRSDITPTLIALVAMPLVLVGRRRDSPGAVAFAWMAFAALALLLIVELVYVDDFFGPPYDRMNTVFKFHYGVWVILGALIGPGILLGFRWLTRDRGALRLTARLTYVVVLGVLGTVALAYPYAAARAKIEASGSSGTLDGLAQARAQSPDDFAVVEWLALNVGVNAVVIEAPGTPYSEESRVGMWAGLPTVIGWGQHEDLWRDTDPRVTTRITDAETLYTTRDVDTARAILSRYGVTHIMFGAIERARYAAGTEDFLRSFLRPVFVRGQSVVFATPGA